MLLVCCGGPLWAQNGWDSPFESTIRTHHRKAWTLSAGTGVFLGMPMQFSSDWIVNQGSFEAPQLDTLHSGTWSSEPLLGWQAGVGQLWMKEDGLWADRVSASFHLGRPRIRETFAGNLKGTEPDTTVTAVDGIVQEASATSIQIDVQTMRAVATGQDGFLELRTGFRASCNLFQERAEPPTHLFAAADLPLWHVAWTIGAGMGLKLYRGRMVRLTVDVDALQLFKSSAPQDARAVTSDVRGIDWMHGAYRPCRVALRHDLFRRKPEQGCAAPTRSKASKTLFDPAMKGVGKAKNKGLKKALQKQQ